MAVAAADIKALFPEITIDDAIVDIWIAIAQSHHNAAAFGDKSDFAVKALSAHFVELHRRRQAGAAAGGTGGVFPLASRTVEKVSTSWATGSSGSALMSDAALAGTAYGQLYLFSRQGIMADRRI